MSFTPHVARSLRALVAAVFALAMVMALAVPVGAHGSRCTNRSVNRARSGNAIAVLGGTATSGTVMNLNTVTQSCNIVSFGTTSTAARAVNISINVARSGNAIAVGPGSVATSGNVTNTNTVTQTNTIVTGVPTQ